MPLIATRGAASVQGFGEFAQSGPVNYIEDVFSTYLYTGTGSSNTITNNIDISGKGGLVWAKGRTNAEVHGLFDTARGANLWLSSNTTDAQTTYGGSFGVTAFNNNGFTLGTGTAVNAGTVNYVSWTFREQPKFFDIVTYTGTGSPRTVSHNLGSAPGCIIVKRYDSTGSWAVWHRSGTQTNGKFAAFLNTSGAYEDQAENLWGSETVAPDMNASTFGVGTAGSVNSNGFTYVAYLFAHNAGGFGTSGSDNVISCGSYTGNGSTSGPTVTLGYEPQWLMIKAASTTGSWQMIDNMRGMVVGGNEARLLANSTSAELSNDYLSPTATGFQLVSTSSEVNGNGQTYIYIAIRRGPMKTPTTGTSVYNAIAYTGNDASNRQITGLGFPPDLALVKARSQVRNYGWEDRLRGADKWLVSSGSDDESTYSDFGAGGPLLQDGITIGANGLTNEAPTTYIFQGMRRAPGFFDVVCYTGTGSATTVSHNLGVVPELMIVKRRSGTAVNWAIYSATLGNDKFMEFTTTGSQDNPSGSMWNLTTPTSSVFSLGGSGQTNTSSGTYVAYLFATVAGVSKVGTYTGTGTTLQVNCGFTGGSRFVLIKRTDSTGDWYVWDSARGIVAGNDPYLLLNSTAAEVTNTDYVDTYSAGFEISSTAPAAINANGGTFIFLAVA